MTVELKRLHWRTTSGVVAAGFLVALLAAGAGWAVATVFDEPDEVLEAAPFTTVEVVEGEVGASISLNTVAEWTPVPVGSNQAAGTVTSVAVSPGQEVGPGAVLYTVNLRPVVIAQGEIPAFRALSAGVNGTDVAQLQTLLTAVQRYSGPIDGRFGPRVAAAVRAWQRALGIEQTGVVEPGDVIFVPALPTRIALDGERVRRGAALGGGEEVLSGLPASPEFRIPVTEQQAALIATGTRIEITSPSGAAWAGIAGEQTTQEDGTIEVAVTGQDGATVCGEACGEVPVTEPALLSSRIVTVETVTGLTVPSAALRTEANGTVAVIDAAGNVLPVTVVTSARGLSVIEGVDAGTSVRVPAVEG